MKIFVIALVVGVSAAMPQGTVDAEADIFSQPAERYGGNDETGLDQDGAHGDDDFGVESIHDSSDESSNLDPDLVDDVFNTGDSAKQVETNFVDRKCSYYEQDGYSCVPYYNCGEDNFIITDGGGLIDIRGGFSKPHDPATSGCDGYLEQCCRHPSFAGKPIITTTTPKPTPKPYISRCGNRNVDGVGVRIQNLNNYENGKNAQFGEWPHMCAVLEKKLVGEEIVNLYVCGASLISPGVVLTAAHCVSKLQAPNVKVRCGEWDTQTTIEPAPHQDRDVKYISIHPEYNSLPPLNLWYDFALLHMDYEFELNYHVDTICLPDIDDYINSYDPKQCVATGWGKDKFGKDGIYQVVMKQVTMDIVDNQQCQNKLRSTRLGEFFKLHKTFICAGGKAGEDTCKGDGGGPLVCPVYDEFGTRYVQAGIIAWGIECGLHDTPGVYANVADSLCFIHNDMMCKYGNADYFGISKCDKWVKRRVQRANRKYDEFQAQQVAYQADNGGKRSRTLGSKIAYYQQVINAYDNFWGTCPGVGNSEPLVDDNTYGDSDYNDDKDEFETDLSSYVRTSPPE